MRGLQVVTVACSQLGEDVKISSFIVVLWSTCHDVSYRFVLLKERNMLLTTLQAYEDATEQMPNEERIGKVEMYM